MISATKKDMEPPYLPGSFVSKKNKEVWTSLSPRYCDSLKITMVNTTTQFNRDSDDSDI